MKETDLTVPQRLMLLAVNEKTGRVRGSYLETVLGGAALAELMFQRIVEADEKKGSKLRLATPFAGDDRVLKRSLEAMSATGLGSQQERRVSRLLNAINGGHQSLRDDVCAQLVERGAFTQETEKFLFFFDRTIYPHKDPALVTELKARLEKGLFEDGPLSERDSVTIALAQQTDLLRANFSSLKLHQHRGRIRNIVNGKHIASDATKNIIDAMKVAAMTTPVLAASATNSG